MPTRLYLASDIQQRVSNRGPTCMMPSRLYLASDMEQGAYIHKRLYLVSDIQQRVSNRGHTYMMSSRLYLASTMEERTYRLTHQTWSDIQGTYMYAYHTVLYPTADLHTCLPDLSDIQQGTNIHYLSSFIRSPEGDQHTLSGVIGYLQETFNNQHAYQI